MGASTGRVFATGEWSDLEAAYPMLAPVIIRRARDSGLVEPYDLVQDVIIRIHDGGPRLLTLSELKSYARTIARNLLISAQRARDHDRHGIEQAKQEHGGQPGHQTAEGFAEYQRALMRVPRLAPQGLAPGGADSPDGNATQGVALDRAAIEAWREVADPAVLAEQLSIQRRVLSHPALSPQGWKAVYQYHFDDINWAEMAQGLGYTNGSGPWKAAQTVYNEIRAALRDEGYDAPQPPPSFQRRIPPRRDSGTDLPPSPRDKDRS